MAQKLRFPGVPVYMNGQNYYIPSLTVRDFRSNYDLLISAAEPNGTPLQVFDKFLPIVLLAINRNYPEVTMEQLEEWLDLHTFIQALQAVQNASGMKAVSEGE